VQSRESFLAWNENYPENNNDDKNTEESTPAVDSPGKPLSVVIEKSAFFLGIIVMIMM
jgi:hypothetical protein